MPNQDLDALFLRTLARDYESDDAWAAVRDLQKLGTREVFDRAAEWCGLKQPLKRARGADVLAQLGKTASHPKTLFVDESYRVLTELLGKESDTLVLNSAIHALGHLDQPAAIVQIVRFASSSEPDIRFAAAFALGCYPNDEQSVSTLLALMKDSDSDVRDWATFGLGVLGDRDSSEIREALLQNLMDADEDVREEAMVGLAKRKDLRALTAVRNTLQETYESPRAMEAACYLLELEPWNAPADVDACLEALAKQFPNHA